VAADLQRRVQRADVVILNASEAALLTGIATPEEAAGRLASEGLTAVVTRGPDGALSAADGSIHRASAPQVTVADATGAGDLFAAAFAWAELTGAERPLELACLYASLSVRRSTAFDGALALEDFMGEATERGLTR
jgi:sugar/nucleoside kinase (ribokinase family)